MTTVHPVEKVEKPRKRSRKVFYRTEDRQAVAAAVKDRPFREFLSALEATGARPQEVRAVEARHFVETGGRAAWVFPSDESKGEENPRIVLLPPEIAELTRRLVAAHPDGPLFRNLHGEPWTSNAVRCRFRRLKIKTGVPKLMAYGYRHTAGTEWLQAGVDPITVSRLMGHASLQTTDSVYVHLQMEHLARAFDKKG